MPHELRNGRDNMSEVEDDNMSEVIDAKIRNNAMDLEVVRSKMERLLAEQRKLLKEKKDLQLIKDTLSDGEITTDTASDERMA